MKAFFRLLGHIRPLRGRVALIVLLSVVVSLLSVTRVSSLGPLLLAFFQGTPPTELVHIGESGPLAEWGQRVNELARPLLELGERNLVGFVAAAMGFLLVVTFLRGVATFFQEFLTGTLSARVSIDLANDLYDHTLGLSLANYSRVGVADPVTRFTVDLENVAIGIGTVFGKTIQEPVTFLTCLAALIGINPRLTLVVFIVIPLLGLIAFVIGKEVKRAMRNALGVLSRRTRQLQETFRSIRVVKAFVMEPVEGERFRALNEQLYRQRRRMSAGNAGVSPLLELLGIFGGSVIIVLAAQALVSKRMPPEGFGAFVGALVLAMESVRKLSNVNNRVQVMLAAAERIFELRDEVPTVTEKPGATALPPLREAVRFEGVHFRYTAEEPVLRGVDLEVRRGERIAFVGASGVGKTTLVSLVPRFYDPTAGQVTVDGLDLREVTLRSLRDQIGLVTQEVFLFDDSVRANIAYGKPGATDAEIEAAARKAYADGFVRDLPRGYDTVVGEDAVILSGGQRQRLALARAILKDPAIFILDEATSQLDSESERAIQQALEAFTRDRTTFIIAHRLSTVEHADRIVVMEAGRIADVGTHAELLTRSPLYRNLHQLQFAG